MEAFNSSIPLPFSYTFASSTSTSNSNPGNPNNTCSNYNPWMDSRIWSKLPQRLLERVIVFLPPPAFFRARCVCKRWYRLLFSHTFLQLYFQVSPRLHWFLFFKHMSLKSNIAKNTTTTTTSNGPTGITTSNPTCEGYLFDPYEITWYRLTFPLIPSGFSPSASSGGLICFVSDEAGTKSLILYNPLLNTLSQLPPTPRPRLFPSIGLNVSPSSIDVSVAGDDMISQFAVKNLSNESFHIDTGGFYSLWGTTSPLPRLCSLESGQMVHVNQKFYCMNYSPFSILSYEVPTNTWSKIQAPMRRFLRSPSLVNSMGKLVLIAAVEKSKLNVPKSLRLWVLQACGTTWVELERMPWQLYVQFCEVEGGRGFDCVGHGEFIVIVVRGGRGLDHNKALLFDICRKRWQWIPPCPFLPWGGGGGGGGGEGELLGFAYEPRLATPVTGLLDQLAISFQSFNG